MFPLCAWAFMWFVVFDCAKSVILLKCFSLAQLRAPHTCTDNSTNYGNRQSGKMPFLFSHIHHLHLRFLMLHAVYAVHFKRTAFCRRNQLWTIPIERTAFVFYEVYCDANECAHIGLGVLCASCSLIQLLSHSLSLRLLLRALQCIISSCTENAWIVLGACALCVAALEC